RRRLPCTCGLVEWHARNSGGAVTRESDGGYVLRLTPRRSARVVACWFCGGYERQERGFTRAGAPCLCGAVRGWSSDPLLPGEVDPMMTESSFPGVGLCYYCVVCGGRLPPSRRPQFVTQPSPPDLADFLERTADLRTLEEVRRALGEPDYD